MKSHSKGSSNKDLYFIIVIAFFAVLGITVVALDYSNVIKLGIFPKRRENINNNNQN